MNLKEKIQYTLEKITDVKSNIVRGTIGYAIWRGLGGESLLHLADKPIGELEISFKDYDPFFLFLGMMLFGLKHGEIEGKYKRIKAKRQMHEAYQNLPAGLNLGDYQLLYLKRNLPIESRKNLISLLEETHNESKHLPTVGVELGYSKRVSLKTINILNTSSCFIRNQVPKSYTSFHGNSEIRTMPTNPYSFYWLIEEIMANLPETNPSVQICVGSVNQKRTPWILSSLSLITPSCILPEAVVWNVEMGIGFPGAYIGQTAELNLKGTCRLVPQAQTNYYIMYSSDWKEIADAAFYASKLHILPDKKFKEFEEELATLFGFKEDPRKEIHENYWSSESDPFNIYGQPPYRVNENLRLLILNHAKNHLKLKDLEEKVKLSLIEGKEGLTIPEMERVGRVNTSVKAIMVKYAITTPTDIIYCSSLEDALRLTNYPTGGE